jgi:hypothetical protein
MSDDLWTFGGTPFRRLVSGDDPQWFPTRIERTIDAIANGSSRVINRGATVYEPLEMIAWCSTAAEATALRSRYATEATLISPAGWSATALLVQADPIIADGITHRLRLVFEVVR